MKKFTAVLLGFTIVSTLNIFAFAETTERENYGYLPYVRESVKIVKKSSISLMGASSDLPEKYDSRDYGYVSPIKNQKSTNSCWAHAAIGVLESYILKNYGEKDENGKVINNAAFDFSENHMQYMISKSNNNPLGYETGTGKDGGGNSFFAASYFLNDSGPVDETDDPLENSETRDYSATKDIKKSDYKVDSVEFVEQYLYLGVDSNKQSLIDETKALIMNYGATTCGINANSSYFSADNESLYCNEAVETTHQVILVGWDDTYSKNNFKTAPNTDGAFIAKNSWGASKHGDGFFYISYCDYNLFFDVMTVTKASKRDENEILYNLDPYYPIAATGFSYSIGDDLYPINCYGNIFECQTDNETLSAVKFKGYAGYTYNIYLIDCLPSLDSEQGTISFKDYNKQFLGSYTPENEGYFTVDTKDIKITSDKFAIMLSVNLSEPIWMPYENNLDGFITKASCNEGESFCGSTGNDGFFFSYFPSENNEKYFNNYPIKAVTKTDEPYAELEFANFTDSVGTEKTSFSEGDTVYIVPALNGVNLTDKEIVCVGYKDNVLQSVLYKNVSDKNRFQINNIPSDFSKWKFYMYVWEMNELKPICRGVSVGVQ